MLIYILYFSEKIKIVNKYINNNKKFKLIINKLIIFII